MGILSYDEFPIILITEHFHYVSICWSSSDKKKKSQQLFQRLLQHIAFWEEKKQFTQKTLSRFQLSALVCIALRYTTCFLAILIQQFLPGRDLTLWKRHSQCYSQIPCYIITVNYSMKNRTKQRLFISTLCFQHVNCNCDNGSFFKKMVTRLRFFNQRIKQIL